MKSKMGRREFLGKAAVTALTVPAVLQGGLKTAHAKDGPPEARRQGATPVKRISIEEHLSSPEDNMAVRPPFDVNTVRVPISRLKDIEQVRLPLMNESGITMQVLNANYPGYSGQGDADAVIATIRKINDGLAETVKKYPDRFAAFASLPLWDPKAAANELERTVTQLGFKGTMIKGSTNGEYYDQQKFWVLWERAEGLGVPIYLHPAEPSPDYQGHPELKGPIWSWGVETATHALRIVGSGVFDAFPKATLILGHLGESLPFLLGRFDEGYVMSHKPVKLKKLFSQYIQDNIVVTTSGKYRPEALLCTIAALGADRVLFAVDYPWVTPEDGVACVENTPLSDSDREKIYHLNAERLLRL
jgi:2,3-dihydroxybenzoate decarboxylase